MLKKTNKTAKFNDVYKTMKTIEREVYLNDEGKEVIFYPAGSELEISHIRNEIWDLEVIVNKPASKVVKGLTVSNISAYGIERAEQYDFSDDGSNFRGFIYKGLPMTQCKYDGIIYLCIRWDYLEGNLFTWNEWKETEEYKLADAFNGVAEFDMKDLIENLEKVLAKVNELNENAHVDEAELEEAKRKLAADMSDVSEFVAYVKENLEWWNLDGWKLTDAAREMKHLEWGLSNAAKMMNTTDLLKQKRFIEYYRDGYNLVLNTRKFDEDYSVKSLRRFMGEN